MFTIRRAATRVASPLVSLACASFANTASMGVAGMSGQMWALVKAKRERGIWMEKVAVPKLAPGHVMIKITKTSICGTDAHIYEWNEWAQKTIPVPMHVGHEYCGEVVDVAPGVVSCKVGDRVSGDGHITCKTCRNCRAGYRHLCRNTKGVGVNRPGAFAEYLTIPDENVFVLPDSISDEMASILDPYGNAAHTALQWDQVGEDVLITGAGPIGCMAAAICKHVGARNVVVTDVNPYRLDLARKLGATLAVNVAGKDGVATLREVMKSLGMTEGFDVGLEMSGNINGLRNMLNVMNHGGKVSILGIPSGSDTGIDWGLVIFKMLKIRGIYGREMFETWYKMCSMVQSGLNIAPVITHRFPVKRYKEGFEIMCSGNSGKIILDWGNL